MTKQFYLLILVISYVRSSGYTVEDVRKMFPKKKENQIILDPKHYLTELSKDTIVSQMKDMPDVDHEKILNIFVIVDEFENRSHKFYNEKDIIEFSENLIQEQYLYEKDRDRSLFVIYSIKDRLYRIRTGIKVRNILID